MISLHLLNVCLEIDYHDLMYQEYLNRNDSSRIFDDNEECNNHLFHSATKSSN